MSMYSANITAGALRVRESRVLASLLIHNTPAAEWDRLVVEDNILQMPNPASARRLTRLLRQRLETVTPGIWRMIVDGSHMEAVQALFAAAILHSPLLRDFLDLVLRDHYRLRAETLPKHVWGPFLEGCEARDPDIATWSESTREKVRQVCYTILAEVGFLSDTRRLRLQTVRILPSVTACLGGTPAQAALPFMEVGT